MDEIREAFFKQKTLWNAFCDFDAELDKFVVRSATTNPSHAAGENREYNLFKAGYKSAQQEIDRLKKNQNEAVELLEELKALIPIRSYYMVGKIDKLLLKIKDVE